MSKQDLVYKRLSFTSHYIITDEPIHECAEQEMECMVCEGLINHDQKSWLIFIPAKSSDMAICDDCFSGVCIENSKV